MDGFPITYQGCVFPWHCDHMGHMNIRWYTAMFDDATWSFFASLGLTSSFMRENRCGLAALQQNTTYQSELLPGEVVVIRSRMQELRGKVIRFRHEMTKMENAKLVAATDFTGTHLNLETRRAMPFPDAVSARIHAMISAYEEAV